MINKLSETSAEEAGFFPDQIERIRQWAASWVDTDHAHSLVLLADRESLFNIGLCRYRMDPGALAGWFKVMRDGPGAMVCCNREAPTIIRARVAVPG